MGEPEIVLLLSGKRKSGKDYICEKIRAAVGEDISIIHISGPLKSLYAKEHNLDFDELLSDGPYKENYRRDMINWSDEIRESDPGYFCKAACEEAEVKFVWMVSDIRRKTDIEWFKNRFGRKIRTIRVETDDQTREQRGWKFTEGVDDVVSECDLDDYKNWDLKIANSVGSKLQTDIERIFAFINGVRKRVY